MHQKYYRVAARFPERRTDDVGEKCTSLRRARRIAKYYNRERVRRGFKGCNVFVKHYDNT